MAQRRKHRGVQLGAAVVAGAALLFLVLYVSRREERRPAALPASGPVGTAEAGANLREPARFDAQDSERDAVAPSEESQSESRETIDLEAKYAGLTALELKLARADLEAELRVKSRAHLEDRYERGLFSVMQGVYDPKEGGYWFRGGGLLYQATMGVPGSSEIRHYVELPVEEYPELYAKKSELGFLDQQLHALEKAK